MPAQDAAVTDWCVPALDCLQVSALNPPARQINIQIFVSRFYVLVASCPTLMGRDVAKMWVSWIWMSHWCDYIGIKQLGFCMNCSMWVAKGWLMRACACVCVRACVCRSKVTDVGVYLWRRFLAPCNGCNHDMVPHGGLSRFRCITWDTKNL